MTEVLEFTLDSMTVTFTSLSERGVGGAEISSPPEKRGHDSWSKLISVKSVRKGSSKGSVFELRGILSRVGGEMGGVGEELEVGVMGSESDSNPRSLSKIPIPIRLPAASSGHAAGEEWAWLPSSERNIWTRTGSSGTGERGAWSNSLGVGPNSGGRGLSKSTKKMQQFVNQEKGYFQ